MCQPFFGSRTVQPQMRMEPVSEEGILWLENKWSLTIPKSPCDVDKVKYKYSLRQQSACLHSMQGGCVKGIWPDYLFILCVGDLSDIVVPKTQLRCPYC